MAKNYSIYNTGSGQIFQPTSRQILKESPVWKILPWHCNTDSVEKLELYIDMLHAWNKRINLTASYSKEEIFYKLVQDSFYLAIFMNDLLGCAEETVFWDMGAGAGLPGIPLRILWQHGFYTMIEARRKRALFLQNVLARLKLPQTAIYTGTVQNFYRQQVKDCSCEQNRPDCLISRAFMPWQELLPFAMPMLKSNGFIIIMANNEPQDLPTDWSVKHVTNYRIENRNHWLWGLQHTGEKTDL